MRVLVTGASGRLGGRLATLLSADFEVVVAYHSSPVPFGLETVPLSLTDAASLTAAVERSRADAILHGAALANADLCEKHPMLAQAVNADAASRLATISHKLGLRLVSISTDLVLSGDAPRSSEDVQARPILHYGRTKRLGEEAVITEAPDAAVVRVALVCGRGFGRAGTASESVLWELLSNRLVRGFTDQYRTPIDPESVADAVIRLFRSTASGLFHVAGTERLSRFELALRTARLFRLQERLVRPVLRSALQLGVSRPADVSMSTERARRELGWEPRPLDLALRESRVQPEKM